MAKFRFRLQRVLDYREILEQTAKDAYLEARATRLVAEAEAEQFSIRREKLVAGTSETLQDRLAIERMMNRIDDEERQQAMVIEILSQEEETKREEWIEKRKEQETLVKLCERDKEEWLIEEKRREQAESDEWAVNRRAS
jgi:flagellar FliJ protein